MATSATQSSDVQEAGPCIAAATPAMPSREVPENQRDRSRSPRRIPRIPECEDAPKKVECRLNPHKRALLVRLCREANVSACLPPLGAINDYDLHWTDVPGNDLDIYEPGDEEERHAFHQSQRRGNSKKRKQEAESLPPSDRLRWEPPSHTVVSEWPDGKRWGFWNNPEPLKCGRQELPSKPLAELPVDLGREAIQEIPKTGAVLWIIEAETDAGASARVPRFLLEEALETGRDCCIAIGVPQIAAARALADRVAEEAGEKVGNSVGLFTDEDKVQPMTRRSLSFATFGSLLRRVRRSIKGCCTLVLDEVHEASVELEFLLLAVKEILAYNKNRWTDRTLKVVLMSATPNIVKLREYFSEVVADVRHLEVPRGCPVKLRFFDKWPPEIQCGPRLWPQVNPLAIASLVQHLLQRDGGPGGNILIFLPDLAEIEEVEREIRNSSSGAIRIQKLHRSSQNRLLPMGGVATVILATNMAETSVTIPNIGMVIDQGLSKEKSDFGFNTVPASQQNVKRRACRAGRKEAGEYFALFKLEEYNQLPEFQTPEICRVPLQEHLLGILCDVPEELPATYLKKAMNAPEAKKVEDGIYTLQRLGLASYGAWPSPTPLGQCANKLPLEVHWAVPMVLSAFVGLEDQMALIVALLTQQPNFKKSASQKGKQQLSEWADLCESELLADFCLLFEHERGRIEHPNDFGPKTLLDQLVQKAERMKEHVIGLFPGIDQLRSRLPIERRSAHSSSVQQLRQWWPALRLLLAAGLRENVAIPSDTTGKFITAWKKSDAAEGHGRPTAWQGPMLFVEMFNFCLRGLSHCPMDDLVLFSHRLRWSSGAGDKPLTVNSWLKVDATFADAALLAAGGNAILQLAQRWAEGKGYGHSDQQAAALLWQVCSDRGDLPLTPLHDLPEPGPPDRKCSMLSTGTKPWASLRDAFRLLYSALVPYTPDLWDEAMRALQEAWPQCRSCREDLEAFEQFLPDYLPPSSDSLGSPSLGSWVDLNKLATLLAKQLEPPRKNQQVPVCEIKFTQESASCYIAHGKHKGLLVSDVARMASDGHIAWDAPELRLDVVWWHGCFRSLNNRHLAVLKQAGAEKCLVREWPLTPGLFLPGSNRSVLQKFIEVQTSRVGGCTIQLKDRSRCSP